MNRPICPETSLAIPPLRAVVVATGVFATGWVLAVSTTVVTSLAGGTLSNLGWWNLLPEPVWSALVVAPAVALAIELLLVGWQGCSLRRLLIGPSGSARSDIAYLLFDLSGGGDALTKLATLGLIVWIERLAERDLGLVSLRGLPLWAALPAIWLVETFFNYWGHRFLHSRWMWPIHRVHHSATEFTMITGTRQHPVETLVEASGQVLPLALLGFAPEHIAVFYVLFGPWALFTHSNWTAAAFVERLGIMSPAGHRLHHGIAPEHHDRNFGQMTTLWDRLFGTYLAPGPDVDDVRIGAAAPAGLCNTTNPAAEMVRQTGDWLTTMARQAAIKAQSAVAVRR